MEVVKSQTYNCDIHGEYEERKLTIPTLDKVIIIKTCQKCDEENRKIEDLAEKAAEKERAENLANRKKFQAGISRRNLNKTFNDYKCNSPLQQKAKASCEKFVNDFPNSKNLLLLGSVGTGKTHLASAVVDSLVDTNECLIIKAIDLIRALKGSWSNESTDTEVGLIAKFSNLKLLVIDEVGTQFGSDTEKLFMFDIIDGRYQNVLPTILISNLDIDGLKEIIGERCLDRLREDGGSVVAFNWESQRGMKS